MRVLLAHNYYQQPGGEDVVVENEQALLSAHGHKVQLCMDSNDRIAGPWAAAKAAWRAPYSPEARAGMAALLAERAPDVVHVHNFFPLLTPSIYDACRDARVPVVQTLHNFRTICAGALLMRGGRPCEDCIGGSPYRGALHGCYRGSRPASLAVARMIATHRRRRTWHTKVDRFIALTEFSRSRFVKAGFPGGRIAVKPNFVEDRAQEAGPREGALFVGRLSPEKGVHTMLLAWDGLDVTLRIAGDGPLLDTARDAGMPNVDVPGRTAPEAVATEMARAAFLVFPSEWYEGFPMTLVEAFCRGLPVIASRLGSMAEIVEDGVTGLHFTPGDAADLAAKVRWAASHAEDMRRMGANARRVYEEKYTPETNYRQLMAIYEQAIESNRSPTPPSPP